MEFLQLQYYRCLNYHFKSLPRHLSTALQAHPCKTDKDKLLLGHLSWPWALGRDELFIIPAPSLFRVQHTGERLEKCFQKQLSQSCGQWPWVLGQEDKGGFDALKKFLWGMGNLQLLQKFNCTLVSKDPYNVQAKPWWENSHNLMSLLKVIVRNQEADHR